MKTSRKKEHVPAEWQQAVGVFIPKDQNSHTINKFRHILLLSMEGKIFLSILARRMSNHLMGNGYIDTICQKASIPGYPGCIGHSVIWDQFLLAKKEKSDLHVVRLDLAHAYDSVSHKLIQPAHVLQHGGIHDRMATAGMWDCHGVCHLPQPF